ncbi:hypothetical protein A8H26_21840 [Pluralibacter gergoviae]|nr:hypothetical protein A8H26_21840 [Pluralibacter gergoviae]
MCCTSNFCHQKSDFACALYKVISDSLKRFSVICSSFLKPDGASFSIKAETIQFSERGELCSS